MYSPTLEVSVQDVTLWIFWWSMLQQYHDYSGLNSTSGPAYIEHSFNNRPQVAVFGVPAGNSSAGVGTIFSGRTLDSSNVIFSRKTTSHRWCFKNSYTSILLSWSCLSNISPIEVNPPDIHQTSTRQPLKRDLLGNGICHLKFGPNMTKSVVQWVDIFWPIPPKYPLD